VARAHPTTPDRHTPPAAPALGSPPPLDAALALRTPSLLDAANPPGARTSHAGATPTSVSALAQTHGLVLS
jgi:hypothetical protein